MFTGFVKWFNDAKGFGFIRYQGEQDLFVHQSDITSNGYRTLLADEEVSFDVTTAADGRVKAVNVLRTPEAEAATVRPNNEASR